MNYIQELMTGCEELDRKGQAYLDGLPFLPNDEVKQRIFVKARELFDAANEDWDAVPEWVAQTMDGHMPYSVIPRNGSLYFSLAFSIVSMEAHLRNLLERVEGRETKELDFPVIFPKPVIPDDEPPPKKPRKRTPTKKV